MNEDMKKTGRNIGYARVSLESMCADRQTQSLAPICDKVYVEKISGAAQKRPVFDKVIAGLKGGDTLVLLDFDRGFRSSIDALTTMQDLKDRGVNLRVVNMNLDFSTEIGEVIFSILAALAQFEKRMISRRTKEGLAAARRRGVRLGRPRKRVLS